MLLSFLLTLCVLSVGTCNPIEKWNESAPFSDTTLATTSHNLATSLDGATLFAWDSDGRLFGLNAHTGALLWKSQLPQSAGSLGAPVARRDDDGGVTVYHSAYVYRFSSDGTMAWSVVLPYVDLTKQPQIFLDQNNTRVIVLYYITNGQMNVAVTAIDAVRGVTAWTTSAFAESFVRQRPILSDQFMYVTVVVDAFATPRIFELALSNGTIGWKYNCQYSTCVGLTFIGGYLIANLGAGAANLGDGSFNNRVCALDTQSSTNALQWCSAPCGAARPAVWGASLGNDEIVVQVATPEVVCVHDATTGRLTSIVGTPGSNMSTAQPPIVSQDARSIFMVAHNPSDSEKVFNLSVFHSAAVGAEWNRIWGQQVGPQAHSVDITVDDAESPTLYVLSTFNPPAPDPSNHSRIWSSTLSALQTAQPSWQPSWYSKVVQRLKMLFRL